MSVLWALIIGILSLIPPTQFPKHDYLFEGIDKAVHGIIYFVLVVLLAKRVWVKKRAITADNSALKICFGIAVSYGACIEVIQGTVFVYRSFELLDIVANAVGAIIGVVAIKLYVKPA